MDPWTAVAVFVASAVLVTVAVLAMVALSRASGRCLHGSCSGARQAHRDGASLACPGCPNRSAADAGGHDGGGAKPLR